MWEGSGERGKHNPKQTEEHRHKKHRHTKISSMDGEVPDRAPQFHLRQPLLLLCCDTVNTRMMLCCLGVVICQIHTPRGVIKRRPHDDYYLQKKFWQQVQRKSDLYQNEEIHRLPHHYFLRSLCLDDVEDHRSGPDLHAQRLQPPKHRRRQSDGIPPPRRVGVGRHFYSGPR